MKRIISLLFLMAAGGLAAGNSTSSTTTSTTTVTPAAGICEGVNPTQGWWATQEFGFTQSNYSMGDFVRYTVAQSAAGVGVAPANPVDSVNAGQAIGYNIYFNMVNIPYAQDAYNFNNNPATNQIFNFIGYLYAGYAALNIEPVSSSTVLSWLTLFRTAGMGNNKGGSLDFDNNPQATRTIQLIDYTGRAVPTQVAADILVDTSLLIDIGEYFSNARTRHDGTSTLFNIKDATASCAWSTNSTDGNYVLAIEASPSSYAAPYGQFFGARLAHILGAVVNDVPTTVAVNDLDASGDAIWCSLMPTGSPAPQLAIMDGGPFTQANAPSGITTASTAHFGSLRHFVNEWVKKNNRWFNPANSPASPSVKHSTVHSYLTNHLLPTLQRFAPSATSTPLCSYQISKTGTNVQLIEINDSGVTSYDNGSIVAIQNNTGDQLYVKQCVAAAAGSTSTTPTCNQIAVLDTSLNSNCFLHTASMMDATGTPILGNMIQIEDKSANASVYVQLVTAELLQNVESTMGGSGTPFYVNPVGSQPAGTSLIYNESTTGLDYAVPSGTPAYLLITNFDVTNTATINNQSRMQAINVGAFNNLSPYCVTLQINKENINYGLLNTTNYSVVQSGESTNIAKQTFVLYPSIVSVKTFNWMNPYASQPQDPGSPSTIPLLLLPDFVMNAGAKGLEAHYGVWLMAYAAALTEFKFNCKFGDTFDCLKNTFGMFDVKSQQPARVVIDAAGLLQSGETIATKVMTTLHGQPAPLTLMGSDVFDAGQNFHQDIPILNLYQNKAGVVVLNDSNNPFINFAINFEKVKIEQDEQSNVSQTFADGYGLPYSEMMLFSLPAQDLTSGVIAEISQPMQGQYQIIFKQNLTPEAISTMQAAYATDLQAPSPGPNNTPAQAQAIADQADYGILAVQKVSLGASDLQTVMINLLNQQDPNWSGMTQLMPNTLPAVGQTQQFALVCEVNGSAYRLRVQPVQQLQAQQNQQERAANTAKMKAQEEAQIKASKAAAAKAKEKKQVAKKEKKKKEKKLTKKQLEAEKKKFWGKKDTLEQNAVEKSKAKAFWSKEMGQA